MNISIIIVKGKQLVILSALLCFSCISLTAQDSLRHEIEKISNGFRTDAYLSFDLHYLFSKESSATVIDDSSLIHIKMQGNKFQGSMENIVFMQNDSINITIYQNEQLMMLSTPTTEGQLSFPVTLWDSLFADKRISWSIVREGKYKKITIEYDQEAGSTLKRFEAWYDGSTYRVHQIKCMIDQDGTTMFSGGSTVPRDAMIVDIRFTNYKVAAFTGRVFEAENYYQKSVMDYTPVKAFKDYEVFIASPGLQ